MRKRLFLNGFLALVVIAAAVGTYFTVHSTSSSASTTQTLATAKRGVVLSSVTSTGNVEAPTDLSLSFQQSGQVTAILVATGEHVRCRSGARAGRRHRAEAGARVGAGRARLGAGEPRRACSAARPRSNGRPTRCRSCRRSRASPGAAGRDRRAAERGEQRHEVPDQAIEQAQQAVTQANAAVTSAQSRRAAGRERAGRTCRRRRIPAASGAARPRTTLLTRYQLAQAQCGTPPTGLDLDNGVTCSQVSNLLTFVKNVQVGAVEPEPGADRA